MLQAVLECESREEDLVVRQALVREQEDGLDGDELHVQNFPRDGAPAYGMAARLRTVYVHVCGILGTLTVMGPARTQIMVVSDEFHAGGEAVGPHVARVVNALPVLRPSNTLYGTSQRSSSVCSGKKKSE
mmetsp:Transcript_3292/g.5979  ORF Transcript_3292/g.5979 Transcript_3292/m.5979 type:complete len:130 (-) Transcript_3292:149-538(-)